ncbi:general secretion pathway protein GspL [Acidovorax sp. sif1233]|uniref:type II secretion system protein GspL n=1 Tax=unclassified Acidovorax TaxID=2684926 RepID=UPI001C478D30|nr:MULTISPECIES: type II secretion system protein GspL [unclassified Acidovorax]MBV7428644.1 general secretion pathway protein GspL [Acidovorax sp. sif0732]MBV7450470.1 general secretion pathway protein GspL [Acidovorax sp. sif0715]MBV7453114.1 general secretion pathway protein GspL [Acidovorax sp. sif1233]
MSTLILFLPPARPGPATEYSYTLTADGHTAIRHASAPAALLPEPTRPGGEVVAVVPARALSWQKVQLPPGLPLGAGQQTPRLRSVLEGLLEDRVLDDASQLHFAIQPAAHPGEPVWVAVCDRAWLRENLQALEAAGRRVARVVPEFAPGPTASGRPELCVLGTPEDACVVLTGQGADHGVAVLPLSNMAMALARAGMPAQAASGEDGDAPVVRAEPAVAALAERTLGQRAALHTASQRALEAARGDWDLAQFDLASTGRTRALRKAGSVASALLYAPQWRAARWGAGLLAAAHLVGLNAWAWQERQALAAKQAAVRATLTQTFPKVQVVVDAPVQMERELAQLRQAAGSVSARDLEPLLAAAGTALPSGRQPTGIEYTPGELRLRGVALAPDEEPALSARLEAAGYRVRLEDGSLLMSAAEGGPRPHAQGTP